jgi:hypothetical protein
MKIKPDATYQYIAGETYECPVGKWAIVKVQVEAGATFQINGKVMLKSIKHDAIKSNSSPRTVSITGGLSSIATPVYATGAAAAALPEAASNDGFISASASPQLADAGATFANDEVWTSETGEFTLLPGDEIVGSASTAHVHVEEFIG